MSARRQIGALCAAAATSLALATTALAGPAGDEYLPKVPQSGAHPSGGSSAQSSGTATTTLPTAGTTSTTEAKKHKPRRKEKARELTPVGSAGSGGSDGGGSSGSILLSPIVLLMIAAVIAATVGMTLRRRNADESETQGDGLPEEERAGSERSGPRTPDGEIVAGPDQAA